MVHVLSPNFQCLSQVKPPQALLMSPESNFPDQDDLPDRIVTLTVIQTAHTLQKQIEKTASELLQALQNQKLKSQNWYFLIKLDDCFSCYIISATKIYFIQLLRNYLRPKNGIPMCESSYLETSAQRNNRLFLFYLFKHND